MEFPRLERPDPPPLDHLRVAENIGRYLATSTVLRSSQVPIFEDTHDFFQDGAQKGYIESPTGSGKSVIIAELTKLILDVPEEAPKPKVLVVTSRKDLVNQIVGQDGTKGFGKFAPELSVLPFFSDSTVTQKRLLTQADVGVTTYESFQISNRTPDFVPIQEVNAEDLSLHYQRLRSFNNAGDFKEAERVAQRAMRRLKGLTSAVTILSNYNVIFLDEAHHIFERGTSGVIQALPRTATIIGFTATADVADDRRLINVLPRKIHSITMLEGMESGVISPMAPMGVSSGTSLEISEKMYSSSGEYLSSRLRGLARNPERNRRIVEIAKFFKGLDLGGIISCIPGGGAWHAKHIAELCNTEGLNAVAVHSAIPTHQRREIYKAFERGEIDVLPFVDLLTEGWDSDRAKYGINGRLTRSIRFAAQRPGRLTRPGSLAYSVDIIDESRIDDLPITVADVLGVDVPLGKTFGKLSEQDQAQLETVLAGLAQRVPLLPELSNSYGNLQELLASTSSGKDSIEVDGRKYAIPSGLNGRYKGINGRLIQKAAEVAHLPLKTVTSVSFDHIRVMYNVSEASDVLYQLPVIQDPSSYYIDSERKKWFAPAGLVKLFSRRYPELNDTVLQEAVTSFASIDNWKVGRHKHYRSGTAARRTTGRYALDLYEVLPLYPANQTTVDSIDAALRMYYQFLDEAAED